MPGVERGRSWDAEADVVIIGTGFAGLAAAIAVLDAGAEPMILEKARHPGGNSIIAGGGAQAVDPARQIPQGICDSTDLHFQQTFEGGDCLADPEKVHYLVENALDRCIHYLERLGVEWSQQVCRGYGALHERTHTVVAYKKWRKGAAIIHALLDHLQMRQQPVLLEHKVTGILREHPLQGRVLGVTADTPQGAKFIRARRAVVLASGGFAANREWVAQYDRRLAEIGTSNRPTATGECIKMAQDIGADTVHMDYIQGSYGKIGYPREAMFLAIQSEEMRRASGSRGYESQAYKIFVNKQGCRFVNEGARRDEICRAALSQERFDARYVIVAQTIQEVGERVGLARDDLIQTIERYNSYCDAKADPEFGKAANLLLPLRTPPFKVESLAMVRHYTMGGLRTYGASGRVMDRWGRIIPCLYAAGEVTGGVHGRNRLGDNAIPECIVFGTLCGRNAAAEPFLDDR